MYTNLENVMEEKGICMKDIIFLILNDEDYYTRISQIEESGISYNEALLIREKFFSEYSLEFLFQ